MLTNYTGKRRPRGNDPEQWKLFFEVNPNRGGEFPEQFKKYVGKEPEKKLLPDVSFIDKKTEEYIRVGTSKTYWSDVLGSTIHVTALDPENSLVMFISSKIMVLPVEKFAKLSLREFRENYINSQDHCIDPSQRKTIAKGGRITVELEGQAVQNKLDLRSWLKSQTS